MSQLFHQLVRPMASTDTKGAFLNGLRIVVIDRTCFDLPDSDENARVLVVRAAVLAHKPHFPNCD
ncbi:MAG: hypothetical protein N4J56_002613 [Chroococcidiopsis sp. SAG 2025]|nr:hypothetical protein [Chroococcidiopsis sp. SAG 2025]